MLVQFKVAKQQIIAEAEEYKQKDKDVQVTFPVFRAKKHDPL